MSRKDNSQSAKKFVLTAFVLSSLVITPTKAVNACKKPIKSIFVKDNISDYWKMVTQAFLNSDVLLDGKFIICKNIINS